MSTKSLPLGFWFLTVGRGISVPTQKITLDRISHGATCPDDDFFRLYRAFLGYFVPYENKHEIRFSASKGHVDMHVIDDLFFFFLRWMG